jgi:hypothetical protein
MTDLVAIAVMRRQALRAEVETLDRFIGTAEWLLRVRADGAATGGSAAAPKPVAKVRDTGSTAGPGEKQGQARAGSAEPSLSGEWGVDTFHFEAVATAS